MVLIPDRAILAMMGGQTLIWAALFYSFVALVPAWEAGMGWSNTAIMGAFSLAAMLWALATPWAGRAIDRGWGPLALPGAGLCGAVLLVALSLVQSYPAFLLVWAGLGLCMSATLYEPAFAMVLRARGEEARKGITAIAITAGFASTLAYPLVHWMTEAQGWRAALQLMAGIAAFLAVPMLALAARWLEAEAGDGAVDGAGDGAGADTVPAARPRRRWRDLLALPRFPLLALAFALIALIPGMMLAHLFPLLSALNVPTATAVLAASLIGPAQVAGRVAITLAAPKARAATITTGAMMALVAATGLMAASGRVPWLVFLAVLAYGVGNGLVGIFRPVLARERYGGADIGAIAGALAGPALFLGALAPLLGALIADWGGYGLMLGVAGTAGLAAAGLLVLTEPRGDAAPHGGRKGA